MNEATGWLLLSSAGSNLAMPITISQTFVLNLAFLKAFTVSHCVGCPALSTVTRKFRRPSLL
jgi:hypothetical protein